MAHPTTIRTGRAICDGPLDSIGFPARGEALTRTRKTTCGVKIIELMATRLDATSGDPLREEVEPHIEEEARLVLDLQHTALVDSVGVGAILTLLRKLVAVGGDLKLCGARPSVERTFRLTRMDRIIEIHADCAEAVASYD